MNEALATVDELSDRLDWTMSDDEKRLARGLLDDLSDDARMYGSSHWEGPWCTPDPVRRLVLRAVGRIMRNPDGHVQSRAGDETVVWSDDTKPDVCFTESEIRSLRSWAGRGDVASVQIYGFSDRRSNAVTDLGYVRVAGSNEKPFPFLNPGGNPW